MIGGVLAVNRNGVNVPRGSRKVMFPLLLTKADV